MTTQAQWQWQEEGTSWKGVGIYHATLTVTSREPLLGTLVRGNQRKPRASNSEKQRAGNSGRQQAGNSEKPRAGNSGRQQAGNSGRQQAASSAPLPFVDCPGFQPGESSSRPPRR